MARYVRIVNARDFVSAKPDQLLAFLEVEHAEAASMLSATDLWFLADRWQSIRTFAVLRPLRREQGRRRARVHLVRGSDEVAHRR